MPSDQSTWLISIPQDGDSEGLFQEVHTKLAGQSRSAASGLSQLPIPSFKTGTLESLISLSEDLPKQDNFFTSTVAKTVDTLRNLLNNEPSKLIQHILVNERTVDDYLLQGWRWNESRYGVQRSLREMLDVLIKEMTSIDNVMKSKLNTYNLAKGSLVQMQRKRTNLVKEFITKYERLTPMVVPRSAINIASDDEFTLFSVAIFKRVHDDFLAKCRENKYIVRDFVYSEDLIEKQREELRTADTTEKELWTELLRLSRINFSESFQVLVHLKVLRLFVESVLRYGLPANYTGIFIKPEPKSTKRTLTTLQQQFSYLSRRSNPGGKNSKSTVNAGEDFVGEYQTLLEQEYFDFVLFEVPWIVL
ncbi:hypothetical protein NLI96_g9247 [Meripilus lineatus]|uniref:V-type proton ATPase subunit C n=1 Tax=Meripilus lineatus TaxID=2056292 RepID=A0AAD5YAF5_9APHY|nr:hypothetical protein NLI96_g9247 [Physisporinus lineatus]